MENEILLAIKHVKEFSKKKVTTAKIESFARKNKIDISTDELKKIVKNMVSDGVIQKQGEKQVISSYYFPEQSDNSIEVVLDTLEVSSEETVDSTQVEDTRQESVTPDADNNKETETMLSVLKDLDSLKSFQETVEKRLFDLEKALISNKTTPSNSIYNNGTGDENGTSDFILNTLKKRITNLENEISEKDAIIEHLMSQLLLSKNASHNDNSDDKKKNDNFNNKRKSSYTKQDSAKEKWKKLSLQET